MRSKISESINFIGSIIVSSNFHKAELAWVRQKIENDHSKFHPF